MTTLRLFSQITPVAISPAVHHRAQTFAQQVVATLGAGGQGYTDSHQTDRDKIVQDHTTSKIGEEAVRAVFTSLGHAVDGPDYTIYEGHQKSWDPDLRVDGVGLAVKTQRDTTAAHFGWSWTFQWGQQRRDPVLTNPEAWVCLVAFETVASRCWVYPPCQIQELTLADPLMDRLKGEKKVIYARDLPPGLTVRLRLQPNVLPLRAE